MQIQIICEHFPKTAKLTQARVLIKGQMCSENPFFFPGQRENGILFVQNCEFKISFVSFKVQSTLRQQTKERHLQKQKHTKATSEIKVSV